MGKKGDLSNFERGTVIVARWAGLKISNLLSYWDFHTQSILMFTKNGVKREKHPVCSSPEGENALLMLEVRGEWAD